MTRTFIRLTLFCLTFAPLIALIGCERLVNRAIRKQLESTDYEILSDDKIHVILIGTGSPQPSPTHGRPATVVIAGGHFLLFDSGEGTIERVYAQRLPLEKLETVFITHWHSDHFAGIGEVINQTWIWGRQNPIHVYGPEGIDDVLGSVGKAYDLDHSYRAANQDALLPEILAIANTHTVAPRGNEDLPVVWEKDGLKVSAFYVEHQPVEPALGYKIEYGGRTILISGDTRVTEQMTKHGRGADVWVHEAYNTWLVDRSLDVLRELGREEQAARAQNTRHYHADTLELAKQAEEAGIKKLVLTHLIPAPPNRIAEGLFIQGMPNLYHGKLVLGRDGTDIVLKPVK